MQASKVLYIDDSHVECEIVRGLLEAEGFEVLATGDPERGVEIARSGDPGLILIDLHLSDMDGIALARYLRRLPQLQPVPIIALSASLDEEEKRWARAYCDGFLEKPIDTEHFAAQIREMISTGRKAESVIPPLNAGMGEEAGGIAAAAGEDATGSDVGATAAGRGATRAGREAAGAGGDAAGAGEILEPPEVLERIRAAMSHDLRTPLTVIISYASTLAAEKAGPLNEKQKEMLGILVEQGYRMDRLISDLVHQIKGVRS